MSNEKKTIEKLTSRVKIYLVIIALLFILICTYDIKWIIPSVILYILIIIYTIWSNTKKKTEIESHIEEVAWGMNSTVRSTLNKSSIPLLVIETDGNVIFRNPKFNKEFKDVDVITYVDSIIKEIKLEIENNKDKKELTKQLTIGNRVYKVLCEYTVSKKRDKRKQREYMLTLNFINETKYNELFDRYINEKLCIGIAVIDKEMTGKYIDVVKVVANMENAAEFVCKEWIDEVLIVTSGVVPYPRELIEQFTETGVTVHLNLAKVKSVPGKKQFVERVGDYTVLTTSINYASTRDLMLKRLMDIVGGLVGCLITGVLFIFVAPAIYIASPGPIFFAQERVGKNGKRFKMYKFRSMYMDAEERKAELMKDNKLGDGKMFKLDFDPRVIGNKILPDGTHKTGIGDFIRRTSLDEFPQFFNVLRGDMSIIGTRPPLISETNLYELHHRARLAIKPGITGMWQVSGRSDITDFEEVVKLDTQYIQNWSLGYDAKIILKTIKVILKREGSM